VLRAITPLLYANLARRVTTLSGDARVRYRRFDWTERWSIVVK
jgi:hypothetical protein